VVVAISLVRTDVCDSKAFRQCDCLCVATFHINPQLLLTVTQADDIIVALIQHQVQEPRVVGFSIYAVMNKLKLQSAIDDVFSDIHSYRRLHQRISYCRCTSFELRKHSAIRTIQMRDRCFCVGPSYLAATLSFQRRTKRVRRAPSRYVSTVRYR